jgi:hypothetical protein
MPTLPTVAFSIDTSGLDDYVNISRSVGGPNSSTVISKGIVLKRPLTKASGDAGLPITHDVRDS